MGVAQTAPSPAASGASGGGGGGGSGAAVESLMLAYQGQAEVAAQISSRVKEATNSSVGPKTIVVLTPADVAAFVQLRVVRAQGTFLEQRSNALKQEIIDSLPLRLQNGLSVKRDNPAGPFKCVPKPPAAGTPPPPPPKFRAFDLPSVLGNALAPYVSTPAALQTALQTIALASAVNQTVSAANAALNDTSLINIVAGDLRSVGKVYVPSIFAPNIFEADLSNGNPQSILSQALANLEKARRALAVVADAFVSQPKCTGNPANQPVINQVVQDVFTIDGQMDAFEQSLLAGQAVTPSLPAVAVSPQPSPQAGITAVATSSSLQQLIIADLLTQKIANDPNVFLLSIHSLDSGGSTLTSGTSLFGNHVYFSGFAGATFTIYTDGGGSILCSGTTYGYRGFIQAKDMGTSAASPAPTPGDPAKTRYPADGYPGEFLPSVETFVGVCPP